MKIYYCEAEFVVLDGQYDEWTQEHDAVRSEIICATSRGKARSLFTRKYDADFTYPVSIRIVQNSVGIDLTDGLFLPDDEYYVDTHMKLGVFAYSPEKPRRLIYIVETQ